MQIVDSQAGDLVPLLGEQTVGLHLHEGVDVVGVLGQLVQPGLLLTSECDALRVRRGDGHAHCQQEAGRGKEKDGRSQRVLQWFELRGHNRCGEGFRQGCG